VSYRTFHPQDLGIGHLFEHVRDAVIVAEAATGRIVLWNPAATEIFGYPASEALEMNVENLVPARLRDRHRAGLASYRETGHGTYIDSPSLLELPAVRKSGEEICIEMSLSAIEPVGGKAANGGGQERYALAIIREVTDRKRAEEEIRTLNRELEKRVEERTARLETTLAELRASEERFRLLVEGVKDYAIFMLDPQGRISTWNKGAQRIGGYEAGEVIGEHFSIFYTEEDLERSHPEEVLRIAAEEGRYEEEGLRVRKDGSRFWASVLITALKDEAGNLRGFSNVTRDITGRKVREERDHFLLKLSDALRPLTDSTEIQAAAGRVLGQHLGVSRALYAEIDENDEYSIVREDYAAGVPSAAGRHRIDDFNSTLMDELRNGRTLVMDDTEATPGLTPQELAAYECLSVRAQIAVPIMKGGRLVAILAVHQNEPRAWTEEEVALAGETVERTWEAVERARAEQALRRSEERLRLATEAADMFGWEVDLPSDTFKWAENAEKVVGFRLPEAADEVWEIQHPEHRAGVIEAFRRVAATGGEFEIEHRVVVPTTGEEVWALSVGRAITDTGGSPTRVVGITRNITQHKRAEEALKGIRDAERNRIARDLHDGPLQDLAYAVQALEFSRINVRGTNFGEEIREVIGAVRNAVQGLRGAVYDLRLEGEAGEHSLAEMLESLVKLNRRNSPGRRIEFFAEEDLHPPLSRTQQVELLRLLREALANALRHSEAERIRVAAGTAGDKLWAEVEDDGRGFSPTRTEAGMGLKGMRERAHVLGGDLRIRSDPGEGTKVRFELDLKREGPVEPARILLVEDHASMRQALASVFEREPEFTVVGQAGSLDEARGMLHEVDVAIVDLGLPDGYGGDLIRELRTGNPRAQALVLSAALDRGETARAVEAGAAGVLHKTARIEEVVEAVRRLRAGEALLALEEVVELLRYASSRKETEYEAHQAIARLTSREKEVLELLARGLDSKQIAGRLHISVKTEANHMTSILNKLGVHSRLQALVFAVRHGLVEIQ
jgi:PAS domain S-box-containing protein